jgi:hypothetical protein
MNDDEKLSLYIEMWKQTVTVQQHFNDICWRIRGLALTGLTFAVGAAAVAAQHQTTTRLFGVEVQLSSVLAVAGLVLWCSFYFVDHIWYHRLLIGAVRHGEALETVLQAELGAAGLTKTISANSAFTVKVFGFTIVTLRSGRKLPIFYGTVGLLLAAFVVALQLGSSSPATPSKTPSRVPATGLHTTATQPSGTPTSTAKP